MHVLDQPVHVISADLTFHVVPRQDIPVLQTADMLPCNSHIYFADLHTSFCFSFFHRLANGFHCFVNVGYHPTHHAKAVSLAHAQHFDLAVFIHPANDRTDLGGTDIESGHDPVGVYSHSHACF